MEKQFKTVRIELPAGACDGCGGEGQVQGVCATSPENPEGVYAETCATCGGSGLARSPIREQVIEFHKAFIPEQGVGEGPPHVPADAVVRNRLKLVFEEAFELLDAAVADSVEQAKAAVRVLIEDCRLDVDLPAFIDATHDIDYVVEGTRLACGVDGRPIAAEIHSSNMSKVGGHRNEQGKWVKPSTYRKADVAGELRKQGWPS